MCIRDSRSGDRGPGAGPEGNVTLQRRIDRLVRAFVARVTTTAGEAAIAAVAEPIPPSQRAKRSAAELAATRARLRAFLAAHPGQRIEQINRALGTTTAE